MTDSNPSLDELRKVSQALEVTDAAFDPALFQQVIDVLPDALLIVDSKARIVMVNGQLELLFGYPRSMLLGQDFFMFIPQELHEIHRKHFAGYFEQPNVRPMNFAKPLPGVRQDGSRVDVQISLGPLVSKRGMLALALIRRVAHGTS